MKQGTWSVLLGCHSVIHSILVIIAWVKLYKKLPSWWELICIFIHDIGHWGKNYLDDLAKGREDAILKAEREGQTELAEALKAMGIGAFAGWLMLDQIAKMEAAAR